MSSNSEPQVLRPGSQVDGPGEGIIEVIVTDLEMTDPAMLRRPSREPATVPSLMVAERPAPDLSRWFYSTVGWDWYWVDRLVWTDEQWMAWVDRPEHHLVTAWVDGAPAGYFELEQQGSSVELAYFGLMPKFIGQGIGGWMLTEALERAWSVAGTERVWLHTCSLDGPNAVANYQARGLVPVGQYSEWRVDPASA